MREWQADAPIQARVGAQADDQGMAREDWPKWLGEEPASASELKAMLRTVEGVRWTMTKEEKKAQAKKEKKKPVVSDPTPGLFD